MSGQLIKWKCVGSSKTGRRSLCRVTLRWKGQKLTNIEPLSSGQRLVDKAAIRFLCRPGSFQPRQADAPGLQGWNPGAPFTLDGARLQLNAGGLKPFSLSSASPPDSSSMLWLNLWSSLWRLEIENRDITHVKRQGAVCYRSRPPMIVG